MKRILALSLLMTAWLTVPSVVFADVDQCISSLRRLEQASDRAATSAQKVKTSEVDLEDARRDADRCTPSQSNDCSNEIRRLQNALRDYQSAVKDLGSKLNDVSAAINEVSRSCQ